MFDLFNKFIIATYAKSLFYFHPTEKSLALYSDYQLYVGLFPSYEDVKFLKNETFFKILYIRLRSRTLVVSSDYLKFLFRFFSNRSKKISRLRSRLSLMFLKPCVFVTLTFNDVVLASTNFKTRRTYVSRFLKSFNTLYVANVDYGKLNGREHYHAVLQCESIPLNCWYYGVSHVEKCYNYCYSSSKLSHYIVKLVNHALKSTTRSSKILYSRLGG